MKISEIEQAMAAGKHPEIKPDGTVVIHNSPPRPPSRPRPTLEELEAILARPDPDELADLIQHLVRLGLKGEPEKLRRLAEEMARHDWKELPELKEKLAYVLKHVDGRGADDDQA